MSDSDKNKCKNEEIDDSGITKINMGWIKDGFPLESKQKIYWEADDLVITHA